MGLGFGEGGLAFRREALGGVGGIGMNALAADALVADALVADALVADGFAAVALAFGFGDSSELEDTFFLRETLGGLGVAADAFAADAFAADAFAADAFAADAFAADGFAFGDSSELEGIFFLRLTRNVPEDSVLEFSFEEFSFEADVRILISGLISCKVNKCSAISV